MGPHKREAMKKRLATRSIPEYCIYGYVDAVTNGKEEGDGANLIIFVVKPFKHQNKYL
jgi:hypothetical protein